MSLVGLGTQVCWYASLCSGLPGASGGFESRSFRNQARRAHSCPRIQGASKIIRQTIPRLCPKIHSRFTAARGRAENDSPKTASKVHVDVRRIKTSPTLMAQVITYSKSLYLHVRLVPRLRDRAPVAHKSVNSKVN